MVTKPSGSSAAMQEMIIWEPLEWSEMDSNKTNLIKAGNPVWGMSQRGECKVWVWSLDWATRWCYVGWLWWGLQKRSEGGFYTQYLMSQIWVACRYPSGGYRTGSWLFNLHIHKLRLVSIYKSRYHLCKGSDAHKWRRSGTGCKLWAWV